MEFVLDSWASESNLVYKKLVFQGAKRESVINLKSTADSLREVKETVDTETQ